MRLEDLQPVVADLIARPGHDKVRSHLLRLLMDGLGADAARIDFERPVPEVRGRIDALLGRTVFEVKSHLGRERGDAERQLLRYLPQRELDTGQRFVGIATDGAEFRVYCVRDGRLDEIGQFRPKVEEPRGLLGWLESVVVLNDQIPPDVESIRRELGRDSIAYHRAVADIAAFWQDLAASPEANLNRDLWHRLLRVAYGGPIAAPALFFQHTYLTIVAKAIATVGLLGTLPASGAELLDGAAFRNLGIVGAVESDFFDWVLQHPGGGDLVMAIARHANRFRLDNIAADILKGLYESLIDPEQRHDLGEYYTPDWLAERVCRAAIHDPLAERVIDPACGSGTFLFHAVRGLLAAAAAAGLPPGQAVGRAVEQIAGIDIHPVAVIFARATYLLALLPALHQGRPEALIVPVYLGDALQWNAREFMNQRDLEIIVPAQGEAVLAGAGALPDAADDRRVILRFPASLASEPGRFDATLDAMLKLAERDQPVAALAGWLERHAIGNGADTRMIRDTYDALRLLCEQGRNHIWGYVARNLSRPIWLASERQKADVVIGNPPWLDYRRMNAATQSRFAEEMKAAGLWQARVHGAAFDLSAYFFVRAVALYLRQAGRIGFVMPYAAMTRNAYQPFRRGAFSAGGRQDHLRFTAAWAFPSEVAPLFPVPACVLFAERAAAPASLPRSVRTFAGHLPRRDAHPAEADASLTVRAAPWPLGNGSESPYRDRFRAGAKLDPRRLVLVEPVPAGRLGINRAAPLVRGRTGPLDKPPWKDLAPLEAPIEAEFLRPVYLGESIGPFRRFAPALGVIPWDESVGALLNADSAALRGYLHLSQWLADAERLWTEHGKRRISLAQKTDFYGQLSAQFPIRSPRVVYGASGTNAAAAIIFDTASIVDYRLYWTAVETEAEARFLTAVINSETVRARAEKWQSRGQWGARDFDKVMFNLPIPAFDPADPLHRDLAEAAARAETVAAAVPLKEREHFTRTRRRIREALGAAGVAEEIERLVGRLLS